MVWTAEGGRTRHYSASAQVFSEGEGALIVWTADFLPDEAAAARAELTRRLLAEADRESKESDLAATSPTELSWRIGAALGVVGLLPAAALAVYFAVGAPAAINSPAAASASRAAAPRDSAEVAAAVDQLKARLEHDPDHVEGWTLLGRTLTRLQRFAEAREAYGRAIGLSLRLDESLPFVFVHVPRAVANRAAHLQEPGSDAFESPRSDGEP